MAISLDTYASDYVLAELDTLGYAERIARAEREFSEDTRRMLAEICDSCSEILAETMDDLSDFGADFSEIEERYFS